MIPGICIEMRNPIVRYSARVLLWALGWGKA